MAGLTPNAFIGKVDRPTEAELDAALGAAKPVWDELIARLAGEHRVTVQEWRSYSPKAGWSLRLLRGKRTIVWLSPCRNCFRVAFILGDKAMQAARDSGLPARVLKILDRAERYPEGNGIRLEIKGPKEIPTLLRLAAIKIAN